MKIIYFYSPSCGSCRDYEVVVDKLSTELKITAQKQNIEDGSKYQLKGVPTIIIEDDMENKVYENVGNLSYEHLLNDIKRCPMFNTPKTS